MPKSFTAGEPVLVFHNKTRRYQPATYSNRYDDNQSIVIFQEPAGYPGLTADVYEKVEDLTIEKDHLRKAVWQIKKWWTKNRSR